MTSKRPLARRHVSFGGGNHLTGTGSCKARTPEPLQRTVPKPKPPVPTTKDFPPLGAQTRSPATLDECRKCAQCITEGRRGSTPAGRGKASEGSH
ncbi:hypothetical protein MTO96_042649 [Rhipicephalus appendiculatus]